ncbi:MAG: ATP-binding cassette domain-containing protein [Bacilli bacterium]|nr:ATP-binding cassette domain-containing protein [Bacilli bacterium]MDD3304618.1 ATP-binding cassette domain-containing protein [Bacilli bacterium]MDD4053531.1 ATP-binding cassette domain-containing protein [Bacilli bacterium]MDD4411502.1 ATP-binding cassette domain-containing protein [Bacilli bacterium]
MLKVNNITKKFGDLKAVDNLSFEVNEGEIFGLLGVNGAGKTTTFRIIMGLLEADEGNVTLNGKKIDYDITDSIGFLTEERSLLLKMTVFDQVLLYGILKGMEKDSIEEELDKWLERFNIKDYKHRKIKELSKGNQQKIQFITAIINNPKLLILDEPFTGLDPINVEMFMGVIREFKKKGSIIIFSSHFMEHVELFCEKLVILVKGQVVLGGRLSEIKKKYRKKNIIVHGDVEVDKLMKIDGVLEVNKVRNDIEIKIKDDNVVEDVFKYISKCKNITKFNVEEPSLNEIFVSKVGESFDK